MRKFLLYLSIIFIFSCQSESTDSPTHYYRIVGETMGTTYHMTYNDSLGRNFKEEVDSILVAINQGVSTYIEDSDISLFNFNKETNLTFSGDDVAPSHFIHVHKAAQRIYEKTEGYFDPTVMPLVNYWGFGYQEKKAVTKVDSIKVDSLQQLVGLGKIKTKCDGNIIGHSCKLTKNNPNIQLDFSAIAKGYAVDVIDDFFDAKGLENYLVEIGGELSAKGKNLKGNLWSTAINTPKISAGLNEYEAIVLMDNKAIASSGNYRNFYEVNGEWYGHEINPKTGFPEKSNLLSVSILADDCMSADAYATAMMVMGLEKSKALVERLKSIDAFFIFANEEGELETFYTDGFDVIEN